MTPEQILTVAPSGTTYEQATKFAQTYGDTGYELLAAGISWNEVPEFIKHPILQSQTARALLDVALMNDGGIEEFLDGMDKWQQARVQMHRQSRLDGWD